MGLLKILIPVVALTAIALVAMNKHTETTDEYEYRLAREELRARYLEKAAAVWSVPDPVQYEEEQRELFKWWFTEATEVDNRFPQFRAADDAYLATLEERKTTGSLKEAEFERFKASYDQSKEIFDLIKAGKYSPAMTAGDHALRIDFLEFEPATVEGQRAVKGRFVVWGAQRVHRESREQGGTKRSTDIQLQLGDIQVKLFDEKQKPVGEMSFGLPDGDYVPFPEQKIGNFPPMAYIGRFRFPVVPFQAVKAELEGSAVTRLASGRELTGNFKWTRDVPTEWRLREGEVWEGADVEEREELAAPSR